jgi:hypothetical protein
VNRKSIAETRDPDRDPQFRYLATVKQDFLERNQPVISNDSKKRELVGNFLNKGQAWRKESAEVLMHDFPSYATGVAVLYGIYDMARNSGMMVVGTSHDTPAFAVDATGIWLEKAGWPTYSPMREVLILCDSGGSNGYRTHLWKYALWQLAVQHGIAITVCHYPPGASKWNPADHRLFSFISLNWAGVPLRDYETILKYIGRTTTRTGLSVSAILHTDDYPTGIKVTEQQMSEINIRYHETLPAWNYTISA